MIQKKGFHWNRIISYSLLFLFPILYAISYTLISNQKGPFWFTPNQDPDYPYLLNSLNIATLNAPAHTDHPGTTLQTLGAVTLRIAHLFQSIFRLSSDDFTEAVLKNPELYLHLINYVLIGLTAVLLCLLGWLGFRLSNHLFLGLILQTTPFLIARPMLMNEPSRVVPEALVFTVCQLLVLVLVIYLYVDQAAQKKWFTVALGAVFGIGMATKVTFLPMAIFLLLPKGIYRKLLAIATAIISFFIATIPILSQYPRIWNWLFGIASGSGIHGQDKQRDVEVIVENSGEVISRYSQTFFNIVIVLTMICILLFILKLFKKLSIAEAARVKFNEFFFLAILLLIAVWVQVFLTLDKGAEIRYLIPSFSLVGVLVIILMELCLSSLLLISFIQSFFNRFNLHRFKTSVRAIALIGCVIIGIQQVEDASHFINKRATLRRSELQEIQQLLTHNPIYKNCPIIASARASSQAAALFYANTWWADKKFTERLQQLYPNEIFYNPRGGQNSFETYAEEVSLRQLFKQENSCILFRSNPLRGKGGYSVPNVRLAEIWVGELEALYRIASPDRIARPPKQKA
jgi:hypothetical protein